VQALQVELQILAVAVAAQGGKILEVLEVAV
jgi:hypothetical protein